MGQHIDGKVTSSRVTAEVDVRWIPVGGFEDVAQGGNGLDDLCRIGSVRSEAVREHEDAEVLAPGFHFLDELGQESEIAIVRRNREPAT